MKYCCINCFHRQITGLPKKQKTFLYIKLEHFGRNMGMELEARLTDLPDCRYALNKKSFLFQGSFLTV